MFFVRVRCSFAFSIVATCSTADGSDVANYGDSLKIQEITYCSCQLVTQYPEAEPTPTPILYQKEDGQKVLHSNGHH